MPIEDFLHRFKLMLDALTSHPQIRVTHVWIGPPADDEELDGLAQAWGRLPKAIESLYRQANGVQLRWVDRGDETYDPARDDVMQFQGPWRRMFEEAGRYVGLLNVPTLEELRNTESLGWEASAEPDDPLLGAMRFDSYGESQDAVLYFAEGPDDPWVVIGDDYCAHVPPPGEMTLSTYLDRVLATWVSIEHRDRPGPKTLDGLLRVRAPLDPTRLVGQRVVYNEGHPDSVRIHGRVSGLVDVVDPPRGWQYAPTVAEVENDLGETVYVPLRAVDPPDDADRYEELRADPGALRRCLEGPVPAMFDALGHVTECTHGLGTLDGPVLMNHAWAYVALTKVLEPDEAARLLFAAAQRIEEHPDVHVTRPARWPVTRPPTRRRPEVQFSTLASGFFNAAVIHVGLTGPADLAAWLGRPAASLLSRALEGFRARNRLRGYDPLTDVGKPPGWLYAALRGGPTAFGVRDGIHRGAWLGLADFRVVQP